MPYPLAFLMKSDLKIIFLQNIKIRMKQYFLMIGALGCLVFSNSCKKIIELPGPIVPTEDIIEIKTTDGTMYMWLYKQTPLHRANFLKLAGEGFFDSTTFHRIVPAFVIQGGDPNSKDADSTNDGIGGPGYTIPAEFVDSIKHIYGAVGAARDNNPAKASNGSQFYIVVDPNGEPTLNKNYTVFGQIIGNKDLAVTLSLKPRNKVNPKDRPYSNISMDVNVVKFTLAELKSQFNFTP
jgi:cyclophilin family peptidyl-prolyl cis-trans isomerase